MKINKSIKFITKGLFVVCLFLVLFYWFEWRPAQIRIDCAKKVIDHADEKDIKDPNKVSVLFDLCLSKKGLKR